MHARSDSLPPQKIAQLIATVGPSDIQMVHRISAASHGANSVAAGQRLVIDCGHARAARVPLSQMRQKGSQIAALHFIQARIDTGYAADLIVAAAAVPQHSQRSSDAGAVGENRAPIAERPQILGGVEAVSRTG